METRCIIYEMCNYLQLERDRDYNILRYYLLAEKIIICYNTILSL